MDMVHDDGAECPPTPTEASTLLAADTASGDRHEDAAVYSTWAPSARLGAACLVGIGVFSAAFVSGRAPSESGLSGDEALRAHSMDSRYFPLPTFPIS